MQQCVTCGGIYHDVLPDKMRYFHSCSPVRKLVVRTALGQREIIDPPLRVGDTLLADRFFPRPNQRDENVPSTRATDSGRVIAEGKGTTWVADAEVDA